jgi:copper transport protein
VAAPDAHPIEGSFSFTTPAAPAVATTITETQPSLPAQPAVDIAAQVDQALADQAQPVDLEQFLAKDTSRSGETIARAGRILSLSALVLAIGLLAFLATTLIGTSEELEIAFLALRILGVLLVFGAFMEYVGVARISSTSLVTNWDSSAGFSTLLRFSGGVALAMGFTPRTRRVRPKALALSASLLDERYLLAADRFDGPQTQPGERQQTIDARFRWVPGQDSSTIAIATALILISFWFDGHTVSKGPRVVHALLSSIHVAAGSVWVGGVVAMATLLWRRHATGHAGRAHELVVRFSGVATIALGAVALAGLVMSVFVLDSVAEITGTVWGQVLLLKVAAVALASGCGAYNHYVLLPALNAAPGDHEVDAEVRSTVTAEAILLLFVIIATASLVAAAS